MSDEMKLNSLERFRKQSSRFVLEEHGSCEVPAGCGGVVLRWRTPDAGIYAGMHRYLANGNGVDFVDGKRMGTLNREFELGEHLLAMELSACELTTFQMMVVISPDSAAQRPEHVKQQQPTIVTAPDSVWLYTLDEPGEDWQTLNFDDSGWERMVAVDPVPPPQKDWKSYSFERCQKLGASTLGIPAATKSSWLKWFTSEETKANVWIRHRFAFAPIRGGNP